MLRWHIDTVDGRAILQVLCIKPYEFWIKLLSQSGAGWIEATSTSSITSGSFLFTALVQIL